MRVLVCHGRTSVQTALNLLAPDGIKRPYTVLTMDALWWEVAAEYELPRRFFKSKLALMKNALGNHIVAIITKDGEDETISMGASMHAMGAVVLDIHCDD